jgi:hypothetical protein
MAFNTKEQEIIKYGLQSGKSKEEVEKAIANYRLGVNPQKTETQSQPKEESFLGGLKQDLNTRVERTGEILNRPSQDVQLGNVTIPGGLIKGTQLFGQGAGLAANAIEKTVEQVPGVKQTLKAFGGGIDWLSKTPPVKALGDAIGGTQAVQEVTKLYDTDKEFKDTVDAVANIVRLGGDIQLASDAVNFTKNVTNKIVALKNAVKPEGTAGVTPISALAASRVKPVVSGIARDVIPTSERLINTEITKALGLTPSDVKNISLSTGNEVGQFIADNNLIRNTLPELTKSVDDFVSTNYKAVRTEIGKVKNTYTQDTVPRYTEALTEIQKQILDVPGLQTANKEVATLLKKKNPTLSDVQRVKELMDEHFNLYKVTGDVKESVAKQGLANMRKEIKEFVETEVKTNTGVDIKPLNNNVQTARSISDAVETRSTKGLTKSTLSVADLGTFIAASVVGTPVAGILAIVAKKVYESPTFKLKVSKYLDDISDSRKAQIKADLEKGKTPKEIKELQSLVSENSLSIESNIPNKQRIKNSIDGSITRTIKKSNIPKKLENLTQEAKKYKSADDFLKAHYDKMESDKFWSGIPIQKVQLNDIFSKTDINVPPSTYKNNNFKNLVSNIRKNGIKEPIQVWRHEDGSFEIYDGNNRFTAAQELGLKEIPVKIVDNPSRSTLIDLYNKATGKK